MRRVLLIKLLIFCSFGIAGELFSPEKIPDGYPPGRSDAPYGSYSTPYKDLKEVSEQVEVLEKKVYGLSFLSQTDEVQQAKTAYYLEHLTIAMLLKLSEATKLDSFEHQALQSKLRDVYSKVRLYQERLFETMVRRVDVALPGPNGLQIRVEKLGELDVLYECNCRKDVAPTSEEQKTYYSKKLSEFLAAGGSLTEIHKLNRAYIDATTGLLHLEYVEKENGDIWVTEGKAGHVILAEGGPVRAAGQMVLVNGKDHQLSLLVSSNASGSYKPDMLSIKRMASRLAISTGIELEKIRVTAGDPMGTQTLSVLMKAKGIDSKEIKAEVKKIELEAKSIIAQPASYFEAKTEAKNTSCLKAFASLGNSKPQPLRLTYTPK